MSAERFPRFVDAIRRKGLGPALSAGFGYLHGIYLEYELKRWYRGAHASNEQFDRRYGVDTSTAVEVEDLDVEAQRKADSNRFQSIYEHLFEEAFAHVRIDHSRYCFVDFGSGKGKALLLASRYPFKKILGVEFSSMLCDASRQNVAAFRCPRQKTSAIEILCLDARQFHPPSEATVFFFFNPFHGPLMQEVVDRLVVSLREKPRPAWIVYCNPECASCFDGVDLFERIASGRRYRVWRTLAA